MLKVKTSKVDEMLNWFENNQNKPMQVVIHAYELGVYVTMEHGFHITYDEYTIYIYDNVTGNEYHIIHDKDEEAIQITYADGFINTIPDGDFEIHMGGRSDHFGMGFKLL
jgi:acylphosphatase